VNLTQQQIKRMKSAIDEPVYGAEFWTKEMFNEVAAEVERLIGVLELKPDLPKKEIIKRVNEYLIKIYWKRDKYYEAMLKAKEIDMEEVRLYRGAYGLLMQKDDGQSRGNNGELATGTCTANEQAQRLLLEACGVKTHSLSCKMAARPLMTFGHAVTAAQLESGEYVIVDAAHEKWCRAFDKDFAKNVEESYYWKPLSIEIERKLDNAGCGPRFKEVMAAKPNWVKGEKNLASILEVQNEKYRGA